jgi:16S rRNA C967 or C1407 C5-methylase (RsmB/RsmF family)
VLASQDISGVGGENLELWPHRHGTDGFFGVVLTRRLPA